MAGASDRPVENIATCDAMAGLADIGTPHVELVIWRRSLPPRLVNWFAQMQASRLPDLRVLVRPREARSAVEPHLDECGMPPGDLRDLFVRDVCDLVSTYAAIARCDLVDARLERVSHDACWKFHRDCVEARLLTTYRGPATEWVQPRHGARALREQKDFKGPVEHLLQGDVAVFKGSCAGPGSGIVHRSPPIEGSGQTRLLLCLNRRSATSPAPWRRT